MSRIITLLTDFGTSDSYVAEMKGRLLGLAPEATIVDITHDIAPGDVMAGAYVLRRAWPEFPRDTIHVAVVDPGVGTSRRALAVDAAGHLFTGPDNGLLESALAEFQAKAVALPEPATVSKTFHGRDVFVPAAAVLFMVRDIAKLGVPVRDPVRLGVPTARVRDGVASGTVIHIDGFGTLVTNIERAMVEGARTARAGAHAIPILATFADVAPGEPVAFIGSGGTLEIAVRNGRAVDVLKIERGAEISAA